MRTDELLNKLNGEAVVLADEAREISTGYCGDFLSFVMGKAPSNCAWFTVMTNINVAAVATLAEVGVVVLCEGCRPDEALVNKAELNHVNLIVTKYDIFSAVLKAFSK